MGNLPSRRSAPTARRYDAVFLDAQGTLVDAHPPVPAIYVGVCSRFGVAVDHREVAVAIRELWHESRPSRPGATYETSEEATRRFWADFNTRVFRRLGMEAGLEEFLEALWDAFGRPENWRLYPEVRDVLSELRRRGYRLGVVSNWDSRLLDISRHLGLSDLLDFVLVSAAAGMEKPDRRIFELALARAGVPPRRALHVGDDYEADVLGATGAGIDAILIDRHGRSSVGATTVRSLEELLAILP